MTYKSILVHAESVPEAAPRLAVAAALAERFDATLLGLGAEWLDWIGVSDPYGIMAADWMTVMRDRMDADLAAAEEAFRAAAGKVRSEWQSQMDTPGPAMARLARAADLIVTGGAPLSDTGVYCTAHPVDLIMHCGRPVLVAPPTGGPLRAKKIVLAWKDTREARRALADAMPFFKRAEEVVVVEACSEANLAMAEQTTAQIVAHLARHGVQARAVARTVAPDRVATELKIQAQGIDADLIVCGAYGHSRAREWMMGGVTHELLNWPETFVLFSH